MRYRDLWQRLLSLYDEREAKAIVRLVLEERFGLTLAEMLLGDIEIKDNRYKIGEEELESLMHRLEQGEPVQYVLGEAWFYGHRFHVEPGVLIPRPETELLVEWALQRDIQIIDKEIKEAPRRGMNVLDIGTGSGCIAISLALGLPSASVTAWDVSDAALRIAQGNAEQLGANVSFVKQDALAAPDDVALWDVIVSNPPYVCASEAAQMEPHVLEHEPHEALFVPDNDALLFYRTIARYAHQALKPGGLLYFEINPLYADELSSMLKSQGFVEIELRNDQFGKCRMVKALKIEN
ncbi:MAG: peptide chain release factor N(5)-glutamine methyltransferase [Prevotella sp.]|nr:peptide chain release factor N(5)-glutamine methyltransferase [Prevotella sp.]